MYVHNMYVPTYVLQLVAQRLKVKSMDSRMEMEAQYDDDIRDGRTLRQKVSLVANGVCYSMWIILMFFIVEGS